MKKLGYSMLSVFVLTCYNIFAEDVSEVKVALKVTTLVAPISEAEGVRAYVQFAVNADEKPQEFKMNLKDSIPSGIIPLEGVSMDHTIGFLKLSNDKIVIAIDGDNFLGYKQQLIVLKRKSGGEWENIVQVTLFDEIRVDEKIIKKNEQGETVGFDSRATPLIIHSCRPKNATATSPYPLTLELRDNSIFVRYTHQSTEKKYEQAVSLQ